MGYYVLKWDIILLLFLIIRFFLSLIARTPINEQFKMKCSCLFIKRLKYLAIFYEPLSRRDSTSQNELIRLLKKVDVAIEALTLYEVTSCGKICLLQ